jgi:hypothetical protein
MAFKKGHWYTSKYYTITFGKPLKCLGTEKRGEVGIFVNYHKQRQLWWWISDFFEDVPFSIEHIVNSIINKVRLIWE